MAKKKRVVRRKVKSTDKNTLDGLLQSAIDALLPEEVGSAEQIGNNIISLIGSNPLKILGPCIVTQCTKDGMDKKYRRISMVGGEELRFGQCYFGKRDGLIFIAQAITVPLGMNLADLENATIEIAYKNAKRLLTVGDKNFGDFLKERINLEASPEAFITEAKAMVDKEMRERMMKDAEEKRSSYGSNWGAF